MRGRTFSHQGLTLNAFQRLDLGVAFNASRFKIMINALRFFDSHCQLQFPEFKDDLPLVLERMRENNVGAIVVGTDYEMSRAAVELAGTHEFLWATVGVHPNDSKNVEFNSDQFEDLANSEKVVAIGECGLDYYRNDPGDALERERQMRLFRKQIELAVKISKPLMVHSRNAYEDIIEIISEYKKDNRNLSGVIHFYSGSLDQAKKFIELGFAISFAGPITFPKATEYSEVIRNIPITSILSETDAPFAAPLPYRGKRNEPSYVIEVVKKIAEIRGEDFEIVREALVQNILRTFKLV